VTKNTILGPADYRRKM